jgi:hypothetical protein
MVKYIHLLLQSAHGLSWALSVILPPNPLPAVPCDPGNKAVQQNQEAVLDRSRYGRPPVSVARDGVRFQKTTVFPEDFA